jgi:CheY-like chemotaxis protein
MKQEIFIIDDDPIFRMIVSKMIQRIDFSVTITECEHGEIGLTQLEKLKNVTHEIIVLLDINMPLLNGWEFLDKLKKFESYNLPQLKIYMVSSSTNVKDVLRINEYPFVSYFLHKPLSKENLKTIIASSNS